MSEWKALCCRDVQEADVAESASLQEAEAAVNKAQQVLHLSLPIADPDAGMHNNNNNYYYYHW